MVVGDDETFQGWGLRAGKESRDCKAHTANTSDWVRWRVWRYPEAVIRVIYNAQMYSNGENISKACIAIAFGASITNTEGSLKGEDDTMPYSDQVWVP